MQQCAPPMEIYARPANVFVAGFIGTPSMNFVPATLQKLGGGYVIDCGAFQIAAPASANEKLEAYAGKSVIFGVRPADITLYLTAGTHSLVATIDAETKAQDGQTLDAVLDLAKTHLFDAETEQAIY